MKTKSDWIYGIYYEEIDNLDNGCSETNRLGFKNYIRLRLIITEIGGM